MEPDVDSRRHEDQRDELGPHAPEEAYRSLQRRESTDRLGERRGSGEEEDDGENDAGYDEAEDPESDEDRAGPCGRADCAESSAHGAPGARGGSRSEGEWSERGLGEEEPGEEDADGDRVRDAPAETDAEGVGGRRAGGFAQQVATLRIGRVRVRGRP